MKEIYKGIYGETITLNKCKEFIVISMEDDEANWSEICIPCEDAVEIANALIEECK